MLPAEVMGGDFVAADACKAANAAASGVLGGDFVAADARKAANAAARGVSRGDQPRGP
jgi:hypothetical protein